MMTRDVTYTPAERAVLWALAVVGVVGVNTAFVYGLLVQPELLDAALSNPVSAAFIIESLLLMCLFAYLLAKWGVSRLHWGWFIALSLIGSMAFALPIVLLWGKRPHMSHMIARHWRGLAKTEWADEYVAHLRTETFPQLSGIPGFIDARILRRAVTEGVEFLIVTQWESLQAIHGFAGEEAERAMVPETVRRMMVDFDRTVRHYEVI